MCYVLLDVKHIFYLRRQRVLCTTRRKTRFISEPSACAMYY